MKTTEPIWSTIDHLPDGHRLFAVKGKTINLKATRRIAIADNSGRSPQDTDEGIFWLDFDWNLIISSPDNVLCIPVKRDSDGERFSTVTDMATMLLLSNEFNWPIEDQHTGTIYHAIKEGKHD